MLATLWVDHGIYIPYVSMVLQNDLCFLPRPFSKLQPAPVNYRAETPFQPDFDNAALRKYVHCQKIVRKPASDWYNQTSYKAAFDLPYFSAGKSSILCCTHYFFLGKRGIRQTREVRSAVNINQLKLHWEKKWIVLSHFFFFHKREQPPIPQSHTLFTTNT